MKPNTYVEVLRGTHVYLRGTVVSVYGDMSYVDIAGVGVVPVSTSMLKTIGRGER